MGFASLSLQLVNVLFLFASFLFPLFTLAGPSYKAPLATAVTTVTGENAALFGNGCVVCHGPSAPPTTPFGDELQIIAEGAGYSLGGAGSWTNPNLNGGATIAQVFEKLVRDSLEKDSDSDGASNEDELKASTNPGDSSSTPGGAGGGGGSGGGNGGGSSDGGGEPAPDIEILDARDDLNNNKKSANTLSGCGSSRTALRSVAHPYSKADLSHYWIFGLIFFLPLSLLALLRRKK